MKATGTSLQTGQFSNGQSSLEIRSLLCIGTSYALGTFTHNFYKQAAILIAAATSMTGMQSTAVVLFSLPFILFSAWAGALADRVAKKNIIVAVKSLELLTLLVGGYMLRADSWTGILIVMFLMGTQSTFYSPSINGSIPENFPSALVPRANALIKLASTAAILAGMAVSGFVLDIRETSFGGILPDLGLRGAEYGRAMAASTMAAIGFLGFLMAIALPKKPAAARQGKRPAFPWAGPIDSVKQTWACREDKPLMLVLLASAWFYGIAAIAVISIANLAAGLAFSKSTAGLLTALLMIGVAAGSLVAGRFSADSWRFLLVPSAFGMAAMLALVGATPLLPTSQNEIFRIVWFGGTLFLSGFCGGLYIIPLESYIQVHPAPDAKGRVIAISKFTSFMAMAIFSAVFRVISLLPAAGTFVVYGIATVCFCQFFAAQRLRTLNTKNLPGSTFCFLGLLLRSILFLRYRVTEKGLEALAPACEGTGGAKKAGILILPNHPALIDPVILYSRLAGLRPRPLVDEGQMRGFAQHIAANITRAVTIPDLSKTGRQGYDSVRQGLEAITTALKAGENIILYPSGRVYRSSREDLGNKAAAAHILAAVPEARVILVRTKGLWGSSFGYASGTVPQMMHLLTRGLLTILGNLIFFTPRRAVHIEYAEPFDVPRGSDKATLNRYLEHFYNEVETPVLRVPRFFWQKR